MRLVLLITISIISASVPSLTELKAEETLPPSKQKAVVYEEWQLKGLYAALDDPDPKVRKDALEELSKSGKRSDVPQLPALLKDENPQVRRIALITAASMGESSRDLIPLLIASLDNPDYGIRYNAASALARIGGLS
ncbi:MAG TPA: HEAT repeat domain-containing protein, partial [Thermodesulfobacteriota bacterium]|nr:HEAT repeat domain-containing protein [Thermodesulfobacteriota bacterium]